MDFIGSKILELDSIKLKDNKIFYKNKEIPNTNQIINSQSISLYQIIEYLKYHPNYLLYKKNSKNVINYMAIPIIIKNIKENLDFYYENPIERYNTGINFRNMFKMKNKILITDSLMFKINFGNFEKLFVNGKFEPSGFEKLLDAGNVFSFRGVEFELVCGECDDAFMSFNCVYKDLPSLFVRFKDEESVGTNEIVIDLNSDDIEKNPNQNVDYCIKNVWLWIFDVLNK